VAAPYGEIRLQCNVVESPERVAAGDLREQVKGNVLVSIAILGFAHALVAFVGDQFDVGEIWDFRTGYGIVRNGVKGLYEGLIGKANLPIRYKFMESI
jgi:hypothetical protein